MAVQMTREEYERQYGSAPVLPQSKLDTTPAPIRMTKEEYNQLYRATNKPAPLRDRLADVGSSVSSEISGNIQGTGEFADQGVLRRGVQATAAGFSTVPRGAYELLPGFARKGIDKAGEIIGKGFDATTGAIAKTPLFQDVGRAEAEARAKGEPSPIQGTRDLLGTLGAGGEIAGTIVGAKETAALAGSAARFAPIAVNTAKKAGERLSLVPNDTKLVTNRAKVLNDIESSYATTRKANEFSKDGGQASRARIAATDVLVDAVDENGVIRTKQPGGAVEQYRAATIDGVEDIVRRNLDKEGKTVSLPEVRNRLKTAIASSGLEGADLVTALRGVERELKGLSMRSDSLGEISLSKLQDAKINTTKNINFNTPPETATYRKTVARAYKEVIEDKSDFNVKEVNAELSKFYDDIKRLERLDGRRVKGGKLGKYFATVSGNIVGGAAGSVGGPGGAALGAILGGEVSDLLQSRGMRTTFGRETGAMAPKNEVLDAARRRADGPAGRSLGVPDAPVGVPARLLEGATAAQKKQVAKLERQLQDNVKAQKAAIKAKDFTLVQSLKDVYDAIKEQLKRLVNEIIESAKNPSIGLSIKATITPEQKRVIARELEAYDTTPMNYLDQGRKAFSTEGSDLDFEIELLQQKNLDGKFTDADAIRARELLEERGILIDLPGAQRNNLGQRNTKYNATQSQNKNVNISSTIDNTADNANATTKTTDLLEEARKYDSAEEFVGAQGTPLFHGTDFFSAQKIDKEGFKLPEKTEGVRGAALGRGVYLTDSESAATNLFADRRDSGSPYRGKTFEIYLDPSINIKKADSEGFFRNDPDVLDESGNFDPVKLTEKYQALGFDGIQADLMGTQEIVIFDPEKLKTRAQLKNIWKKANQ